ncbi:MAG: lipopolysaccharide heptosyltransferase II [Candidatus Omnitrophota bacterium]
MERILIVTQNWRGDVLFSTPLIRALRDKYPQSFIAALVVPRCVEILEHNPRLNEVIVFDEEGPHKGFWGKLKLIGQLRRRRFTAVFFLHRSLTRALLCFLAGIPERIGYNSKKRGWLLTRRITAPMERLHKVEYFLNLARALGIETAHKEYEFFLDDDDKKFIDQLLSEHDLKAADRLIVLNPGGNWGLKRWPKENFSRLGDELSEKYQAKVLITGAENDLALAQAIAGQMRQRPVIFCAKTTLGELAALLAKADLVVANDSGPMHIALSQKAKVIALFGPTDPLITGPYGGGNYFVINKNTDCQIPCYELKCRQNFCMQAITVEDVLSAAEKLLSKK